MSSKYKPESVNFHYTRLCNFSCGFCFHTKKSSDKLPIEDAIRGCDMLKKAGSKMLFDFLPQCFIGNISKKINSKCLELTYKELLSTNFIKELKKDKEIENNAEYKKYLKNKETLEYLEKNKEISKNSGFDIIKDRKYKELLKVYFSSSEFEDSIVRLKQENESSDYIQEYIYRAKHYVDFYSKNNNSEEKEDVDSDEE